MYSEKIMKAAGTPLKEKIKRRLLPIDAAITALRSIFPLQQSALTRAAF